MDFIAVLDDLMMGANRDGASRSETCEALSSSIIQQVHESPETFPNALQRSLEAANRRIDHASLAVTGLSWLGSGVPSVEYQMTSLVRGCCRELYLCAYSITSGAVPFLGEVREVVSQGVQATVVVNDFAAQPHGIQSYLQESVRRQPQRMRLFNFAPSVDNTELHAKVLVIDRWAALVGSANLSFRGMVANHEMAVVLRGPIAESIAARLDRLSDSPRVQPIV